MDCSRMGCRSRQHTIQATGRHPPLKAPMSAVPSSDSWNPGRRHRSRTGQDHSRALAKYRKRAGDSTEPVHQGRHPGPGPLSAPLRHERLTSSDGTCPGSPKSPSGPGAGIPGAAHHRHLGAGAHRADGSGGRGQGPEPGRPGGLHDCARPPARAAGARKRGPGRRAERPCHRPVVGPTTEFPRQVAVGDPPQPAAQNSMDSGGRVRVSFGPALAPTLLSCVDGPYR